MATDPGIELRRLLSQMSGFSIGDRDYVSYFVNNSGERMIYVQKWGEEAAVLLHSDLDWEPQAVEGPPITMADTATATQKKALSNVGIGGALLATPVCGGVILNRAEAQWLSACYSATEPLREAR
ncbi:hypothetical protein ABZ016_29605 [Streptomyces sp. NPDC006372]|uniref:hypothetical protein n=1 Tax=Streptomyces sp. NPDC006372 TaxID=3155599 RepID=UPI0033A103AC